MKQIFTFFIILLMIPLFVQSQSNQPKQQVALAKSSGASFTEISLLKPLTRKSNVTIPNELKEYTLLSLRSNTLKSFKSSAPKTIGLSIPGKKSSILLELVRVDLTTDDFTIMEMPSGKPIQPNSSLIHYRGIVKNSPNSIAAVSISENEISGLISLEGEQGNLVLGKLDNSKDHILYEDKDIRHLNDFVCQTKDTSHQDNKNFEDSKSNEPQQNQTKCPEIFFDIANDVVRDKGGAQGASNFVEAMFNQVAILYDNIDIKIKLSGIRAWTSNAPFNGLGNYRSYRNQNGFNGDLGHFVTYNYSGGVAYLGGVCGSYRYGLSGINRSYNNVPRYSWNISTIAHELGHNFGSNHTHSCSWNGNNTAIDGCYNTEGSCGRPGIPSDGGTIMSYCHLTSAGTNLRKGFGSQPANVIRRTINNGSCIDTCNGGGGDDDDDDDEVSCAGVDEWTSGVNYQAGDKVTYRGRLFIRTANRDWDDLGKCSDDPCAGVANWANNTLYSPGDLVVYLGNLFQRTQSGWNFIEACQNSSINPCEGIPDWEEGVYYQEGDQIVYQGKAFEWNGSEWITLATCPSTPAILTLPSSIRSLTDPISIYPNPAKDFIHLEITELKNARTRIIIRDIQGKEVLTEDINQISPNGSLRHKMNLQSLEGGVYFIQIVNSQMNKTKKILIN